MRAASSEVRGLRMAYREAGSGAPIVFLHGNPTSSPALTHPVLRRPGGTRRRREVAGLLADLEDLRGWADDQRIVVRDHRRIPW